MPSVFAVFAEIVIPSIVGAASTAVAVASWRTARRATQIADAATRAEAARDKRQYERELDDLVSKYVMEVALYSDRARTWARDAEEVETHWFGDPDRIPYEPEPSTALLTGQLEVTHLAARAEDRAVFERIRSYVRSVMQLPMYRRPLWLRRLVTGLRKWRNGTWQTAGFLNFLRDNITRINREATK